jgi:hypothetical protein
MSRSCVWLYSERHSVSTARVVRSRTMGWAGRKRKLRAACSILRKIGRKWTIFEDVMMNLKGVCCENRNWNVFLTREMYCCFEGYVTSWMTFNLSRGTLLFGINLWLIYLLRYWIKPQNDLFSEKLHLLADRLKTGVYICRLCVTKINLSNNINK